MGIMELNAIAGEHGYAVSNITSDTDRVDNLHQSECTQYLFKRIGRTMTTVSSSSSSNIYDDNDSDDDDNTASTSSSISSNMSNKKQVAASENCISISSGRTGDSTSSRSTTYCYSIHGWMFLLIHFFLIACGCIHNLSTFATGTLTCHSWFYGWLIMYYLRCKYSNNNSNINNLQEGGVLLVLLFQLAVGAFAFSKVYYGPFRQFFLKLDRGDLFQSLAVLDFIDSETGKIKLLIHLQNDGETNMFFTKFTLITNSIIEYFVNTVQVRYSFFWFVCEISDVIMHQVPFLILCYIISNNNSGDNNNNNWTVIIDEIKKHWYLTIFIGIIHRFTWDYCTCGYMFCDGPYKGYLKIVPNCEQFLWHFMPCLIFVIGSKLCTPPAESCHSLSSSFGHSKIYAKKTKVIKIN